KAKKSVKLMMEKLFRMELELMLVTQIYCKGLKTINGEESLHALVDDKKIIITKSSIRRDLQLADEEGIDCLLNSTIFEQLAIDETTTWNEFSSTMASAIICLATNQKFNFSKLIFNSMIRNLDNSSGKILMYPRNSLINVHDMNVFAGEEVAEEVVEVINTVKLIIDVAQVSAAGDRVTLKEMKSTNPKQKGVVYYKSWKKRSNLADEETALNLQAEFDEEERLAREKAEKEQEANIALIETWDDI
ncbi:hypothetical protein Tco_1072429, partial [Tanacetum coccineum]